MTVFFKAASRSRGVDFRKLDALTLFCEHRHKPGLSLREFSTRLSRGIDRATGAISLIIDTLMDSGYELTRRLVQTYLPDERKSYYFKRYISQHE